MMIVGITTSVNAMLMTPSRGARLGRPCMSADPAKVFRRAQFWEPDTATLEEIANVVGRWSSAAEWGERTKFAAPTARRVDSMAQAATLERYNYAKRNDLVERVAMQQNLPSLEFKDARLAAAFGKSAAEFNTLPVSKAAIDITFDALAQSKSSLLKLELADQRKSSWLTAEGGIDEGVMAAGLYKSRGLVCFSWLFLGKGRVVGVLVGGRIALDNLNLPTDIIPYSDVLYWVAALVAAYVEVQSQGDVVATTSDYETFSEAEAIAAGKVVPEASKYSTVFEKFAAKDAVAAEGGAAPPTGIDKTEYGSFGVIGIILFFFYLLPSFAKGQGWTG